MAPRSRLLQPVAGRAVPVTAANAALIAAGVLGMAQALGNRPDLARSLALAGAVFLAIYGWQAVRRARQPQLLTAFEGGKAIRRSTVVAQAAAFALLNPHVYLDTALLVGSIGAQQPVALQAWFIAGASTASLVWFGLRVGQSAASTR